MQLLILTDRASARLHVGTTRIALASVMIVAGLVSAFALGFRAGVQDSPPLMADGRFERTVAVMRQQHALDHTRAALAAELDLLGRQVAGLQVKTTQLEGATRAAARAAGLAYRELDSLNAVHAPAVPLANADALARLARQIGRLDAQLDAQLPASETVEFALAERSVHRRTTPAGRPIAKGWVSSPFGPRKDPVSKRRAFHDGLDFAGRYKSPVLAVADGIVAQAGKLGGYGNLVQIEHGNGLASRYAHNQKNLVKVGDKVSRGDVIALMGSTGRSTGAHVHLEIWLNGKPVDPRPYVRRDPAGLAVATP